MRKNQGITLIALIITIIVLLILAGITISLILGENGILNKTMLAGEEYTKASIKEEIELGIVDIETALKEENIQNSLNKDDIIARLPNVIENIVINQDLIGEYKGYDYWIDDKYEVHIGDKFNNFIQASATMTYIGTTSCMVTVQASSTEGQITGYQYRVQDKDSGMINSNSYTIENLEPNTMYIIMIQVTDEQGNRKQISARVTTNDRTYFMKDGVVQTQGVVTNCTVSQKNGYMNMTISRTTARAAYYVDYDLTNYKTLKMDLEVVNKELATNGSSIFVGVLKDDVSYGDSLAGFNIITYSETSKPRETYAINIEKLVGVYHIVCLKNATSSATSASVNIYNIWLEE